MSRGIETKDDVAEAIRNYIISEWPWMKNQEQDVYDNADKHCNGLASLIITGAFNKLNNE